MSSTSLSSSTQSRALSQEKLLIGGDFAGYVGKFSPSDGTLIPLPIYLVPEDLREWGQEPSSLEIMVSEEVNSNDSSLLLERQTITVLPAIGCGVDNLETTKSEDDYDSRESATWSDAADHPSVGTVDTMIEGEEKKRLRLETFFALPEAHRVRVTVDLHVEQLKDENKYAHKIQSPVQIHLERKTSNTSTKGTRADGGGLDGRTVSRLIGDTLRAQLAFAENTSATKGTVWKSSSGALEEVHFPGNITIGSGRIADDNSWVLEVSHFSSSSNSDNNLEGTRRCVQRTFQGFESRATAAVEEDGEFVRA